MCFACSFYKLEIEQKRYLIMIIIAYRLYQRKNIYSGICTTQSRMDTV